MDNIITFYKYGVNYRYRKFENSYTLSGNTLYVVFSGSVRDVIILSVL